MEDSIKTIEYGSGVLVLTPKDLVDFQNTYLKHKGNYETTQPPDEQIADDAFTEFVKQRYYEQCYDELPHCGETAIKKLLEHFASLKKIKIRIEYGIY